jgi:predicted site-specific integrase-resolvase
MTDKSVHISVSEASKKFGITRAYIYTLIKQGRLATNTDEKGNTLIFVEEIKAVAKKKKKRTTKVKEVVETPVKQTKKKTNVTFDNVLSVITLIVGAVVGFVIAHYLFK